MRHLEVNGLKIAYERNGSGDPLVLLHGYVGDHRTWRRQIEELSDEFTVVAWDAPGFGSSSDPPELFRLGDFADCLAMFIRELGFERAHVGGLSFGGGLALELYRRHPSVPRTLVLASAYAGWGGSLPTDEVDRRTAQALQLADKPPEELVDALMPTMFAASAPPERATEFAEMIADFRPSGLRASALAFALADLREVLPRIDVPTLLVYGEEDSRAGAPVGMTLHAEIPPSRFVLLPGVGHVVNMEAPEIFNTELRAFLRWAGS